ncbi:Isopentenyl-diphosphate Delta-isomerase [Corynebacterium atrinae]|uniref:isopentenyl-diphosphate Delta-isomerase n=1 Tax=Corynebacterium atrinae TaxID=1336740 RepID=UPI0025B399F1|nr:isopentenyl-diphosphate Delta-isomerase [Corynebacterium atrinae]WJY63947.1 Isopentenyl-diphosphate Delta-isomerase [Corynebacterium atrinae]
MTDAVELVVLADPSGKPVGTAPKATVHTRNTPLHFAFSCFLLNHEGKLLMTRRALGKRTWPGIWTNSFCGHPGPGETAAEAVARRSVEELGLREGAVEEITEVLPDFSYRAVDSSGIVEWEICPVFVARLVEGEEPAPSPDEVDSMEWVDPAALIQAVEITPFAFSPWLAEELAHQRLREALL